ncbi:MAG: PAS domain-containing protein, partial [Desulfobacteraceae bacterium]|nr:PAS domain-containing protein [Desulfobacteraceae bacterium]
MLLWMLSLPWSVAKSVLPKISLPVLLIFPVVTALLGWLMTNRGVRKRSEEALEQSEERFQMAMEASKDGLWDWNIKTDEVYYSPAYAAILGYDSTEVPSHISSWKDLIHPDDKAKALKVNMDCIENRIEHFKVEFRMQAKNGDWYWILGQGKAVKRDEHGQAIRMVGTHTDITNRKQAEEVLKDNQKFLDSIIEQSPYPTWISDTKGTMTRANPALKKVLNLSDEQLIGKYNVFQDKQLEPDLLQQIRNALENGKTSEYELDWIGKNTGINSMEKGNKVFCEGTIFP